MKMQPGLLDMVCLTLAALHAAALLYMLDMVCLPLAPTAASVSRAGTARCSQVLCEPDSQYNAAGSTMLAMVLLQQKQERIGRSPQLLKGEPAEEVEEVQGDTAPLTPEGFAAVWRVPGAYERELFVSRVAKQQELVVRNRTGLHEWIPVLMEADSLPKLQELLNRVSENDETGWLSKVEGGQFPASLSLMELAGERIQRKLSQKKLSQSEPPSQGSRKQNNKSSEGQVLMEEFGRDGKGKESKGHGNQKHITSDDGKGHDDSHHVSGASASLDEKGYKSIAKLKNQKQMEIFTKRIIDDRGLYLVDEGALKGIVPYYSGAKSTQTFKALNEEIDKALKKKKKGWVSDKDSTSVLTVH